MKEYIVDFESVILEASDENDAYEKARELIEQEDIRICLIEENK